MIIYRLRLAAARREAADLGPRPAITLTGCVDRRDRAVEVETGSPCCGPIDRSANDSAMSM